MLTKEELDDRIRFMRTCINKPKLREDEHYISYLFALIHDNGGYYKEINQICDNLGYPITVGVIHPERLNDPLNEFLRIIKSDETPLSFLMKTTEMKFVNLIEQEESVDYFWIRHYQPVTKYSSIYRNGLVFNMCEDCMREDLWNNHVPMIHLSHQLPGVKVCHNHNKKLYKHYINHQGIMPYSFMKYEETDNTEISECDYHFAQFMYELSKQKINYSLRDIVSDINKKMRNRYGTYYLKETSDDAMVCIYNKYATIGKFVLNKENAPDLFKLMYFIYRDAKNIPIVPENIHLKAFQEMISGKYELIGDYRETIVELRCLECNETFITSPRLILYQHQCPHCKATTKKYYKDLVIHLCENEFGGRYKFKNYDSEKREVALYDKNLKKVREMNVLRFISNFHYRIKDKRIPTSFIWNPYSDYGTFGAYYKGEFIIKNVGREYFIRTMFDLVADEYELVGPYINMFTEVELKHALCGKSVFIKPYDFLNGKRCENCKVKRTAEEITRFLNHEFSGFIFQSNYDRMIDDYLFRVLVIERGYRVSCVEEIYQFTEDVLIQELLKERSYVLATRIFTTSRKYVYDFFFQKDVNCISEKQEDDYE